MGQSIFIFNANTNKSHITNHKMCNVFYFIIAVTSRNRKSKCIYACTTLELAIIK